MISVRCCAPSMQGPRARALHERWRGRPGMEETFLLPNENLMKTAAGMPGFGQSPIQIFVLKFSSWYKQKVHVVKMTAPMPLLRTENFVLEFRFVQLGKNFTDIPLPVENTGHKLRYWCLFMIPVWIYRSEIPVIYRERKIFTDIQLPVKIPVINCGIGVFV